MRNELVCLDKWKVRWADNSSVSTACFNGTRAAGHSLELVKIGWP